MEVRKDFAARVENMCRTIPTQAVESLIVALLPRAPIETRSTLGSDGSATGGTNVMTHAQVFGDPMAKLTKGRASRSRPRGCTVYEVLDKAAWTRHRGGTWRQAMTRAAVRNTDVASALTWLRENYPRHADKGIDFAWCAAQGYIKL